jgi:hypothetical protein
VRISLEGPASEHWGGANDGRMHFPVKELSLCVNKPGAGPMANVIEFANATTVKR